MLRTIQEIKPDWIVAENVRGITNWSDGLVFEQIHIDLENEGYQVQSFILPACGVDAPHRRDRVWIIAYSNSNGHQWRGFGEDRFTETEIESQEDKWERIWSKSWGVSQQRVFTNSEYDRLEHSTDENNEGKIFDKQGRKEFGSDTKHSKLSTPVSLRWPTTNTSGSELQGSKLDRSLESKRQIETESGQFSRSIRSVWKNFPTQSPICSGNDGFPNELLRQRIREDSMGIISEQEIDKILSAAYSRWRKETLKAAGNAIVHQVATQIFKSIKLYYEQ